MVRTGIVPIILVGEKSKVYQEDFSHSVDDWWCNRIGKLNLEVKEGYPSSSQESGGLKMDQFVRVPKSQW